MKIKLDQKIPMSLKETLAVALITVFLSENNRKKIFQNIIIIESALLLVVYAILVALYIMIR